MIIKVTEDDIKNGSPEEPGFCPVTLAIKRQTNSMKCSVSLDNIWIPDIDFPTPERVQDFIEDFDMGLEVKPFEFELGVESNKND